MTDLKNAIQAILDAEDKTAAILDLFNAVFAYLFNFIKGEI